MNFAWPSTYLEYRQQVVDFATAQLQEGAVDRDAKQSFPAEHWKACAAFGIQGLAVPKTYGGQLDEVDFLRAMLAMEGLGYGCPDNGLAFGLNAQMWTVQTPILQFGTDSQKQRYLPKLADGSWIGAHAITESSAGSDVYSMQMTAEKVADGYVLNGHKQLITLAPICDIALVFAKTNPAMGQWGISAFIVDKDTPGFQISSRKDKMGMRCIPIGEFTFEQCVVPESSRLGSEGMGFSILQHSLEYDRCCILASQLGAMERQLEQNIEQAKNRQQFGQSIGKFQAVSHRIANMKLRLETSRLLLYRTAWLKHTGQSAILDSALLKLHLSESFVASSMDSIRNFGGKSYLSEYAIERDLRDAVGGVLYAGTSDIQRNIIGQLLGL